MELLLARILLAAIFGVAGATKLAERRGIGTAISEFGLPARIAAPLGYLLAICELGVALALVVPVTATAGAIGALGLLLVFSAVIALSVARGRRPSCHCFGQLHSAPIGWWMVARNALLASVAGFVAADGRFLSLFVALGAVAASAWLALRLSETVRLRTSRVAPSFSLPDVSGHTWTLAELLGAQTPLALIFGNPDCPGCTAMLPDVAGWQAGLEGRLTVALVSGGSRQDNQTKARVYGLGRVLVDERQAVFPAYGVTATPAAVLIGRDGRLASTPALGARDIAALVETAAGSRREPVNERRELFGRAARAVAGAAALLLFAPASGAMRSLFGSAFAPREAEASPGTQATTLCNQRYALCTTAPCVQSPTDPNVVVCRCNVLDGYSMGYTSCADRAPSGNTLYSTFSLQGLTPQVRGMTCQVPGQGGAWGNCVDVVCQIDPANPSQATCQCVKVVSQEYLIFAGDCDRAACTSTIWSGAATTADLTQPYTSAMRALNQPVPVLGQCSAPKST